nr:MAG TPA: hypothetical protein [Caudoviricetes sp.]
MVDEVVLNAATVTANTGRISGWKMRRARNGRKTMWNKVIATR